MGENRQNIYVILLAGFVLLLNACTASSDKVDEDVVIPVFPLPPEKPRFIYERVIRSSIDVVTEDSTNAFRRFATGEQRHGEGFAKPFDISVDKGRIFIGDTVRRVVMVMDPVGTGKYFEIGREEPGRLYMPLGLAQDAAGNLYVCDGTSKRVTIYDRDGKYIRVLGGKDYFNRPSGVAVDPEGKRVYIVDTGGVESQNHRVRVFDATNGKHLFDIGTRGSEDGEFNLPRDAVLSPYNNQLYVVDGGNFRVQVFDADGKFIRKFGDVGRRTGQFSRPKGITVDRQGNVYVVDTAFGNVQLFSPDGKLLMFLGSRGSADKPARYMLPSGVDTDEDGRVYVVDQFFRKVEVFKPTSLMTGTEAADEPEGSPAQKNTPEEAKPNS